MSLLSFRNICKSYPGVITARDVNLDVGAGEIVGLVGKNGAGKSTLIRIIAGVEHPDTGEIHLNGARVQFQWYVIRRKPAKGYFSQMFGRSGQHSAFGRTNPWG